MGSHKTKYHLSALLPDLWEFCFPILQQSHTHCKPKFCLNYPNMSIMHQSNLFQHVTLAMTLSLFTSVLDTLFRTHFCFRWFSFKSLPVLKLYLPSHLHLEGRWAELSSPKEEWLSPVVGSYTWKAMLFLDCGHYWAGHALCKELESVFWAVSGWPALSTAP